MRCVFVCVPLRWQPISPTRVLFYRVISCDLFIASFNTIVFLFIFVFLFIRFTRHDSRFAGPTIRNMSTLCDISISLVHREKSIYGCFRTFFNSCAIGIELHHSRVRNIPTCECKISVTGCGHISYSWPGESRILPPTLLCYYLLCRTTLLCMAVLFCANLLYSYFDDDNKWHL